MVDLLVLGFILWFHVPFEPIFQTLCIIVVFNLFELSLSARECAIGLDKMSLRLWDKPIR